MNVISVALAVGLSFVVAPSKASPDTLPTWRLEKVGELEVPSSVPLTRIEQLIVDEDGRIYLLDRQLPYVPVLAATGQLLFNIGRHGQGPGEFVRPWRIGIRDHRIWVVDGGNNRLTSFDREGSFTDALDFSTATDASGAAAVLSSWADSSFLALFRTNQGGIWSLAIIDRTLGPVRALDSLDLSDQTIEVQTRERGGGVFRIRNPFSFSDMLALSYTDDIVYLIHRNRPAGEDSGTVEVTIHRVEGSGTGRTGVDVDRLPARDGRDWVAGLGAPERLASAGAISSASALRERLRQALPKPLYNPPIKNGGRGAIDRWVLVDSRGQLWMRTKNNEWQVWDGIQPIARVVTANAVDLIFAEGGRAWSLDYDDLDLPHIVEHRVVHAEWP